MFRTIFKSFVGSPVYLFDDAIPFVWTKIDTRSDTNHSFYICFCAFGNNAMALNHIIHPVFSSFVSASFIAYSFFAQNGEKDALHLYSAQQNGLMQSVGRTDWNKRRRFHLYQFHSETNLSSTFFSSFFSPFFQRVPYVAIDECLCGRNSSLN